MEDFFDDAALADMCAQLGAELEGHEFEIVFDYTPHEGIQAPEGSQEPQFHFDDYHHDNEPPVQFYFDDDGRPCSPNEEDIQCEVIATMKPSKDATEPAKTEVFVDVEEPMSPMPVLVREEPQEVEAIEYCSPKVEVKPPPEVKPAPSEVKSEAIVKMESMPVKSSNASKDSQKDVKARRTKPQMFKTLFNIQKQPQPVAIISLRPSTSSPITINPAPSSYKTIQETVPHPGTLPIFQSKLPNGRSKFGRASRIGNSLGGINMQQNLPLGKRPRMSDVIKARRSNPYLGT